MTLNQGYRYRHVLGPEAVGLSLRTYLARHFSHSSESEWQARIAAGEIFLNDLVAWGEEDLLAGTVLV